ncbi:MAG TPA: ABC transporter substrate-binding protein [Candidatus Competibacter sp.]|nr:branched-chain amino acid ABC transporter substrate-binding protein [Candidatus Competibacteraceae bacterium]HRE54620.1 ABC transporter substrate-binding protein [Candidatus Competibacter sp.]HUM95206.1 ABC transporter substrate-binding protein [Candidatus Competibacter sp.]
MTALSRLTAKIPPCRPGQAYRRRLLVLIALTCLIAQGRAQEPGVTPAAIRIGGIMDLQGVSSARGQAMKAGIEAAFKNEKIQGRSLEFNVLNDSFQPPFAVEAAKKLIEQGVFIMLGNTGTPTTKAVMPLLAEHKIPAVGFPLGAAHLRPGVGDIINFRASFAQETSRMIETALAAGVKPQEICAYLPSDSGGMDNLAMIKTVLEKRPDAEGMIKKIDQIIARPEGQADPNGIGPVGFYKRSELTQARTGYQSLKQWEKTANTQCRLVLAVGGINASTANFVQYSRYRGEKWWVSVTSQIEAASFIKALADFKIDNGVIMTQVVPPLDSSLPIVEDARKAIDGEISNISLEGYIVGKMFLAIMRTVKGELTRENFLKAARGRAFDLGGLPLDFSNDNQGSDLIQFQVLEGGVLKTRSAEQIQKVFQ